MSAATQPDAPETREEQAGAWCARLATDRLSPDEHAAFDRWLAADVGNAASFDRALAVWQALQVVSDAPEVIGMRADALSAMRRANALRWSRRVGIRWRRPLALAASLLLVVIGGALLLSARPHQYVTGLGERRALLLADGSRLSLDAQTRVAVDYEKDHRQLTLLAGRAKFDVAKDAKRPFTVTAGDRTVIATGTAFSVELLDSQVHVIVYDGHVAVVRGAVPAPAALLRIKAHPGSAATGLAPGSELVAELARPAPPQVVRADVERSLAWESGQLDIIDEPLGAAVERVNRYSVDKIAVADARTAAIHIDGVFNAGDSAAFVEAVGAAYDVRAERTADGVVLAAARR